ncbi:DUF2079 domain-containing protein [Desulfohalobiaceae bacterium Ax17]|uniref:DUF2079 domain-containing protein n=1 Tax=Desulfovulcanus ferrireducens TaxID=2831190 RepID=UPI00207BC0B0|nr:DUF2079 domain-containing protein [Desulfovulcanus ferrireducens]MBT8764368.1 DUF2079 domain-containing protein [Desulfovulcanus ferrireducens]
MKTKVLASGLLFIVLAGMALLKYLSLHSAIFDLGIFFAHFYNFVQNGQWWRLFFGHAQPLMPLYAAIYNLLPGNLGPFVVLVFQAFFLALPGFWLQKRFGWPSFLAFALYFPLWFNSLFDFHMDHLVVLILFWFFFLVENNRFWLCLIPGLLLALVKEPFALQTAACGIFLILKAYSSCHDLCRNTSPRLYCLPGLLLILFGLGYFYFVTNFVFPYFTPDGGKGGLDSSAFAWMGNGIGDMFVFIVSHPLVVIKEIFGSTRKVIYLLALFGSLGFIPLLKPLYLIPALPILGISILSRLDNYYGLGHHYTAGLIAPMIMAFTMGLPTARRFWEKLGLNKKSFIFSLCVGLLLAHILLSPSPISRLFWTNKVWSYTASAYLPTARDSMIKKALEQYIPRNPETTVSVQNTINWPILTERNTLLVFPRAALEPTRYPDLKNRTFSGFVDFLKTRTLPKTAYLEIQADYVVLDMNRPWFIGDKGCGWLYGRCQDQEAANRFLEFVDKVKEKYRVVFAKDGFWIFKRIKGKR